MWVAIQRSVGVASSVAAKYVPGWYGAGLRPRVGARDAGGSHSTPMIQDASHARDVGAVGAAGPAGGAAAVEVAVHGVGEVGSSAGKASSTAGS